MDGQILDCIMPDSGYNGVRRFQVPDVVLNDDEWAPFLKSGALAAKIGPYDIATPERLRHGQLLEANLAKSSMSSWSRRSTAGSQ